MLRVSIVYKEEIKNGAGNMGGLSKSLVRMSTTAAILLAAMVAVYALSLLVFGQPWILAYEGGENRGLQFIPALAAFVPLVAVAMLLLGLLTRKKLMTWIGLAILLIFSLLFLFGIGGILLPVSGLLFISLVVIQIGSRITNGG